MPSRTYIQMFLKLHKNGKVWLTKELLKKLNKYNNVLEKHPEAIEEIVQRRVDLIRYAKTIAPHTKISYSHYLIFEQCILDSMFMAELIEPVMFDDFDARPHLINEITMMGFQPVINSAIIKIDYGV